MTTPFDRWLASFAWLRQRGLPCIISPDLDGLACGMFQQRFLGWSIKGTYDGARLCLWEAPKQIDWGRVVFLDLEILRPEARCIGNHMLAIDREHAADLTRELPHCANPNVWREFNAWDSFQRKYPFGTLPLLIASSLCGGGEVRVDRAWLSLILQTDSAFTNAAMYQANALDWLKVMGEVESSPGISRLCTLLRRLPAQTALALVENVQQMAGRAGFGPKQRACRFDPADEVKRGKAAALSAAIAEAVGASDLSWLRTPPVCVERFETATLPAHSKRALRESLATAKSDRVVSMAITGATKEGFSYTRANPQSRVPLFR